MRQLPFPDQTQIIMNPQKSSDFIECQFWLRFAFAAREFPNYHSAANRILAAYAIVFLTVMHVGLWQNPFAELGLNLCRFCVL